MKANRILFDKLKTQYELLKMRGAYILAEQQLNDEAQKQFDLDQNLRIYWKDELGGFTEETITAKDLKIRDLEASLEQVIKAGQAAQEEENYMKLKVLKLEHDTIKSKIDRLRGDSRS